MPLEITYKDSDRPISHFKLPCLMTSTDFAEVTGYEFGREEIIITVSEESVQANIFASLDDAEAFANTLLTLVKQMRAGRS